MLTRLAAGPESKEDSLSLNHTAHHKKEAVYLTGNGLLFLEAAKTSLAFAACP